MSPPLPPPSPPPHASEAAPPIAGVRWHYQLEGTGPLLLLLHGMGGDLHGWDRCLPRLTHHFTVLRVDLPGHGHSRLEAGSPPPGRDPFTLPGMAAAVAALLHHLGARPQVVAGHSAGFPLLLRLVLDGAMAPERLVGICPALVPPPPLLAATLGAPMAALATAPGVARAASWVVRHSAAVPALLRSTGSAVTAAQGAHYAALAGDPARVHAALAMMARWGVRPLLEAAHAVRAPLTLLAGARDRWVPLPALRRAVHRFLPQATLLEAPGGHLLPEEDPARVVALLLGTAGG